MSRQAAALSICVVNQAKHVFPLFNLIHIIDYFDINGSVPRDLSCFPRVALFYGALECVGKLLNGGFVIARGFELRRKIYQDGRHVNFVMSDLGLLPLAAKGRRDFDLSSVRSEEHTSELQSLAYLVC